MVDGSSLPSFIKIIEPEDSYSSKKVYVYATDVDEVGVYWFKIVTTLDDSRY